MPTYPSHHHPQSVPAAYPVYKTPSYVYPNVLVTTGILGTVVGGTAVLATNLHKVQDNQMTMKQAVVDSLAKGAGAGVATAAAAAVASAVRGGAILSLALMVATATGVGYVLNSVGKSVSEKAVGSSEKKS